MVFTFLHTADWQIGKPFGRFEAEKAAILRNARLDCIGRIAEAARTAGASQVLVAGDVFDGETLPDMVLRQTLGRLAAHPDLTWHLLPGNHDPARPGGVWEAIRRLSPAANICVLEQAAAVEMAPGVVLLTAPLVTRAATRDPTLWMDDAPTAPGTVRIGLAHGSVRGFGGLQTAAVRIDPDRPRLAGLSYLALGDWHGTRQITERAWYSGTPEPDSFPDNEPGYVLVVRLESAGAPPQVTRVRTAGFHWTRHRLQTDALAVAEALERQVRDLGAAGSKHLMEIVLEGEVGLAAHAALLQRLAALEGSLFHLGIDQSRLRAVMAATDLDALEDEALRAVAQRLTTSSMQGAADEARIAELALGRLFALAAAVGREDKAA